MSSLASEIKASINWLFQEPLALTTVGDASQLSYDDQLSNGSAADQAEHDLVGSTNRCRQRPRRSRSDESDAHAVRLDAVDRFGQRQSNFADQYFDDDERSACDWIRRSANACTAPFGGSATSLVEIGADSALLLSSKKDGWTVDSSHKILRIANPSADAITYNIVILGTSRSFETAWEQATPRIQRGTTSCQRNPFPARTAKY